VPQWFFTSTVIVCACLLKMLTDASQSIHL
jgi:hypothetical protein